MGLGDALGAYRQALKAESVPALADAAALMAEAIEEHIVSDAIRAGREVAAKQDYPPKTKCVCGELVHPDQPFVEVEADGGLFHWNEDGGGHRADARLT